MESANAGTAGSDHPPLEAISTSALRDYSANSRMLLISAVAAVLGAISSVLSWALLRLIGLATNLFYFHRWEFAEVDPSGNHLGWLAVFVPVIGGLLVGLIARFGSSKIRGHGMPEAVEAVIFGGAKISPRVAILKPVATAISIGSGGPFGAEGPVIASGGAAGSVLAQLLSVTDAERSVLLVCGAASGMAATFACPLSSVLLAVELLLFEWRPRSLVPVAIACATAGALRHILLGPGPIFPMQASASTMHGPSMVCAVLLGAFLALVAIALGRMIHVTEEIYEKLPIHWMWFPAIGGAVVGIGGLIFPQALGVGYSVIGNFTTNNFTWKIVIGVLVVKTIIWVISLSSNTAGGILAPLLMIGAAIGAALSHWLPFISPGAWAVVGMTSLLAASIGAPLTAAMLAVELTHNGGMVVPVLLGCTSAYGISVLFQRRSLLTEGLSKRGHHLFREYGVDPLEMVLVREAMHTSLYALPPHATRRDAVAWLQTMTKRGPDAWSHWQRIFPIVTEDGKLDTILTRSQMIAAADGARTLSKEQLDLSLADYGIRGVATIRDEEPLRSAAERMGKESITSFPVLDAEGKLAGILNVADLLTARVKSSLRENERERVIQLRWPFRGRTVAEEPVAETETPRAN